MTKQKVVINYKVGDKVRAIFRKYGRHEFIGIIKEIETDKHALPGTWVSVLPTEMRKYDEHVDFMINEKLCFLIPECDVLEVIE
ncbi:hypothetical protein SDC9_158202 [bioreactor metagenome]|jgi:hypothetical protein|uniref:KOW domain-containing protein n=1 Tax=bioreactor metagenome TaxID=1076179 RepID=A0A645F946_9ZZZZ|nr:hypothetical protein [Clostridia bacterium]